MSINIGTEAVEAAKRLRNSEEWRIIREALHEQVRSKTNQALDAATEGAVGYARALRDLYLAFQSATNGEPIQRVSKPSPVKA